VLNVDVKESRKKQREVEEKRLTAERAAEEARRKAEEVDSDGLVLSSVIALRDFFVIQH